MSHPVFLAIDLGASSGRIVAGRFGGQTLELSEVHRFSHGPVDVNGRLYWRIFDLWSNILHGLREACRKFGNDVVSVGVDGWGVDFGLLDHHGELLAAPVAYRDGRTRGEFERTFAVVPREEIFAATGIQFMEINTLYQLRAIQRLGSPPLDRAGRLLMMSDMFHWMLTGVAANEQTIASTTQLYDPRAQAWSDDLLARLDLPRELFGPLVAPGTSLGPLRPEVAAETGLHDVQAVVPGSHDTASAVLAVPASNPPPSKGWEQPSTAASGGRAQGGSSCEAIKGGISDASTSMSIESSETSHPLSSEERGSWCYISSGTWSLMGIETTIPVITPDAFRWNFTNEAGVFGTNRLLKNISGLWLIQECQRAWLDEGRGYDWQRLIQLADEAEPLRSVIDVDDPRLLAPCDMPAKIVALSREGGQPPPETHGAIVRCILESLALKYREVLDHLEPLAGHRIDEIHIVGGGSRNGLLCQMTADACERPVLAGPMEATAIGNVLMQAIAAGIIADATAAREVVRRSFELVTYIPRTGGDWTRALQQLSKHRPARV